MFLWLKTLYRKRAVTWPFIFYTIIWTLSNLGFVMLYQALYLSSHGHNYTFMSGGFEAPTYWYFNTFFFRIH